MTIDSTSAETTHLTTSEPAQVGKRRAAGLGLPFFTALFAALIVADLAVVGLLIFRDLSRQVVSEAMLRSREQAETIARQLVPEIPAEGPADLTCVVRTTTTLARYIEGALENFAALQEIAIVNDQGTPVQVFYRRTDMRRRTPEDGLGIPGVLRAGSAPSREFPGRGTAPDGYNIPETDRKVLERLGVPIPAGRLPPGEPRNVVQVRQSQNVQRPRLPEYDVRVPVQLGEGRAGSVNMLLSHGELEREIEHVRRSLVLKVMVGAAASVVLIVLAYFVVLHLLSRTRQVEAETQAADRLSYVGMLAAGLAHEIRNPLSAMKMNLQMVEQELDATPASGDGTPGSGGTGAGAASAEVRELLRESTLQIDRLNDLVTQFLCYARPARLELRPSDLNRVVRETVHFLQAEAGNRNVRTDLALDPQLPPVPLDETQVRQALLNIYRNAFEALDSRGGGTVRAQTSAGNGGPIRLVIEDDGPGVPGDRLERIFTAFFSSKPGGTGLGLPVVQRIVEGHGGSIAVESPPGAGARFILSFPTAQAARAT